MSSMSNISTGCSSDLGSEARVNNEIMVTDLQTHGQLTVGDRRFAQSETVRMCPFYWRKQHWQVYSRKLRLNGGHRASEEEKGPSTPRGKHPGPHQRMNREETLYDRVVEKRYARLFKALIRPCLFGPIRAKRA